MTDIKNIGIRIALIKGLKFAFTFLLIVPLIGLLFGGVLGVMSIGILLSFDYLFISFALLYLTLPLALWYFGKRNSINILRGKNPLRISAEFSFGVNSIIWFVFIISRLFFGTKEDLMYSSFFSIVAVILFGSISTFYMGMPIVQLTTEKIQLHNKIVKKPVD